VRVVSSSLRTKLKIGFRMGAGCMFTSARKPDLQSKGRHEQHVRVESDYWRGPKELGTLWLEPDCGRRVILASSADQNGDEEDLLTRQAGVGKWSWL